MIIFLFGLILVIMLMRKMGEVASLGIRTFEVEGKGYFG
jgi:hypothetical protein